MPEPYIFEKVLAGCLQGDRICQRQLYEHFHGYGLNIALRYAKSREEAKEILNDAFLKFFSKPERYDPALPFKPWLRRVLINSAIDYLRVTQKMPRFLDLDTARDIVDHDLPPMLLPETDALPLVQALPPAYRMVFNLFVMEEYDHREIAALLGISESASRSNLARAKVKLREMIQNHNPVCEGFNAVRVK